MLGHSIRNLNYPARPLPQPKQASGGFQTPPGELWIKVFLSLRRQGSASKRQAMPLGRL